MGMDNTTMIKKNAAIAKATAEKEIAIAQAEADKYEQEQKAAAQMKLADAQKYFAEQETAGIAAKLKAEAEVIAAEIAKPPGQIDKINIYGTTGEQGNEVSQISSSMPVVRNV